MVNKNIFAVIISLFIMCNSAMAEDAPDATKSEITDDNSEVIDPLEDFNRVIFEFNTVFDEILFRPLAELYGEVIPSPVRTGIHNVISNLGAPVVFINDVLQLNPERASETLGRFLINSTVGIGGLIDVASDQGLVYHNEDFGLTLGSYGVDGGPFLMLPLLGPSNLRDAVGKVADIFMDPLNWIAYNNDKDRWLYAKTGLDALDARTNSRNLTDSIEKTIDPYAQYRTLYTQNREYLKTSDKASNKDTVDTSDLPGAD